MHSIIRIITPIIFMKLRQFFQVYNVLRFIGRYSADKHVNINTVPTSFHCHVICKNTIMFTKMRQRPGYSRGNGSDFVNKPITGLFFLYIT